MALLPVTMWRLGCDYPGCGATAQDDGEYHAWGEKFAAIDDADNAGWARGPEPEGENERQYFCQGHTTVWASDLELQYADEWEHATLRGVVWPVIVLNDISKLADGEAYLCELRTDLLAVMTRLEKAA